MNTVPSPLLSEELKKEKKNMQAQINAIPRSLWGGWYFK